MLRQLRSSWPYVALPVSCTCVNPLLLLEVGSSTTFYLYYVRSIFVMRSLNLFYVHAIKHEESYRDLQPHLLPSFFNIKIKGFERYFVASFVNHRRITGTRINNLHDILYINIARTIIGIIASISCKRYTIWIIKSTLLYYFVVIISIKIKQVTKNETNREQN